MGYQITDISLEEAKEKAAQYPYGLVYLFDEILLGKTEEITEGICWEDCMEARFFSEQEELHLFDYNGEKKAVCVKEHKKEEKGQDSLEKLYLLTPKFRKNGFQTLKVKEYLGCDEDGQAQVRLTRLSGLE